MKKLQPKVVISVVIGSLFAYILFGAASERRSAAVSALKHWSQSGAAYLERSRRLILSVDGLPMFNCGFFQPPTSLSLAGSKHRRIGETDRGTEGIAS